MSQSIQVSFVQEGDVYTVHTGSSVLKDIVMDYTGVPERAGRQFVHPAHRGGPELRKYRAALVARGPFPRYPGAGEREPRNPMRTARCALWALVST